MISRDILTTFPTCPGVYLMKNAAGRIVYVGKAKHLRRRLASYFQAEHRLPPKVRIMMPRVEAIDYLCTATEKEALLLEASLIKKHRPKYNIVLRDDKQYVLFCLSRNHPFPALRMTRKVLRDGSVYFGPFTSALSARETRRVIDRLFPLRKCRDTVFANRTRPCLQYHIGRCLGPCCLPVSEEDYRQVVRRVELFLSGKSGELMDGLRAEMTRLADDLDFEGAARLRDSIRAIRDTVERQAAVLSDGRDLDVVGVHAGEGGAALALVFVRQGRVIDGQTFWFAGASVDSPEEAAGLTDSFLLQYYNAERFIPARIVTPFGTPDPALEEALADMRGGRVAGERACNRGSDEGDLCGEKHDQQQDQGGSINNGPGYDHQRENGGGGRSRAKNNPDADQQAILDEEEAAQQNSFVADGVQQSGFRAALEQVSQDNHGGAARPQRKPQAAQHKK